MPMMYISGTSVSNHAGAIMTQIGIKDIRDNLADALNRVAYSGERIVLARRGKGVARLRWRFDELC